MYQWFRDIPMNRKLTVVMLLASLCVLLVAGAAMMTTEFVTSRRELVEDMNVVADLLARNVTAPLQFKREEDVQEAVEILSSVDADPYIALTGLYDDDGAIFARYARPGELTDLPSIAPRPGYRFDGGYLEIIRPVVLNENTIGTIYLRAALNGIYSQLLIHASILGGVLLGAVVLSAALARFLRRPITRPILALAQVARRVADEGDYSARAVRHGSDEVGVLTDAFNFMLGEIERAQQSLERANQSMQTEIEERKLVEEQLRRAHTEVAAAKEAAEAANRAKDQFLAVLSHELRTPLTPVLLTVSLLQNRAQLSEEVQDEIQTIRRHVELEARLIDDLLDLTRITRGKLQLNFEVVDAHEVIRNAIEICCADRISDLVLNLDAQRHHVRADPARLLQVFWNLLSNAVKFTKSGLAIDVRSRTLANGRLQIEVQDRGIGIDPEVLPRIFNAFEQADSSLTRKFGGLGLGLTIVKALVHGHGGTISARSDGREKGATFIVELPTTEPRPQHRSRRVLEPLARSPRPSLRILLVEDHEGTLALMTRLLHDMGHEVKSASSVKEALEIAEHAEIDLVISDLGLPDGTGHDVMRALKSRYSVKGIALSGFGMDDDIRRSLDAGFVKHLTKPVDLERLQIAIQQATN